VGAAVLDDQGRIWSGCNVENVSFGASICAERAAIVGMVTGGGRTVSALAINSKDGGTPCGICLQVLLEFAADPSLLFVWVTSNDGQPREYRLSELLPYGFSSKLVSRTE